MSKGMWKSFTEDFGQNEDFQTVYTEGYRNPHGYCTMPMRASKIVTWDGTREIKEKYR